MRQSRRQVRTYAQRRLDSFVSVCVCVHTPQIYTTYTYSIFISCINFTKSLSRDQNIFSKKKKEHTVEFLLNRTTPVHISSRHTLRRAFAMSLISGRFFSGGCVWFLPSVKPRLLVSTVSRRVALVSSRLCDGKAKCQLIQSTKRTIH